MNPTAVTRMLFTIGLLLGTAAFPPLLHANDPAWLRDQLRQTTVELRRVQDENSALQVKLANASASPVAKPADNRADVTKVRSEMRQEAARLQAELAAANAQLLSTQGALAAANAQAATASRDAAAARQLLLQATQQVQACAQENGELVAISNTLLQKYRDRGVWDALREAEPLTGIARARHEALIEKYRGAIVDATLGTVAPSVRP
jgi:paraquat-inducible protein B